MHNYYYNSTGIGKGAAGMAMAGVGRPALKYLLTYTLNNNYVVVTGRKRNISACRLEL